VVVVSVVSHVKTKARVEEFGMVVLMDRHLWMVMVDR